MVTFTGTTGNDIFTGSNDADDIAGGAGADTLSGGGGSDTLYAGARSPTFNAPYYNNSYTPPVLDTGSEVDYLDGGDGSDQLFAGYGDFVDGGTSSSGYGPDTDTLYISLMGAPIGVTVDFRQLDNNGTLTIGGGTIKNIESVGWIEGSNFADTIIAGNGGGLNFAPIFGRGGDDRITLGYYSGSAWGGDGNDFIDASNSGYGSPQYGEAGDDTLIGGSGYERLDGGDGNDSILGNYGFDELYGGSGADTIDGGSFGDTLYGGSGNDILYGAGDADIVDGGDGNDLIYGDYSLISSSGGLSPSSTNDTLFGGAGADTIYGDDGNDIIWSDGRDTTGYNFVGIEDAGTEKDVLLGGDGNDTFYAGYGDNMDGGGGADTLNLSLAGAPAGLTFSTANLIGASGTAPGGGQLISIESLNSIRATDFADTITIATQTTLVTVDAGAGDDVITSDRSSVNVKGGAGDDRFISGIAGDIFDGGTGFDTVDYRNATAGVTVDLASGSGAGGDTLSQVEGVAGSAFADDLRGTDSANLLQGLAGNDVLTALGGDDTLIGGAGADTMDGGAGNDLFILEAASDSTTDAPDVLRNFEHGRDLVDVTALNVTNYAFAPVAASGSTPAYTNVTLTTQSGASVLLRIDGTANQSDFVVRPVQNGTSGPDLITGTANNDYLSGLEGNDTLNGLAGADTLQGGSGADSMTGGSGDDVYVVDQQGDLVIEAVGGGRDTVFAEASYVLASDTEIEVLSTSVNAGTTAIDLAGNAFAQVIVGNFGNNRLTSGGTSQSGDQNDVLIGLRGDDTYVVDSVRTAVIENAGEGTDQIIVTLAGSNFVLNAATSVESIVAATGTDAINITGNPDAQVLIGNDGANILSGAGGGDTLIGLGGNDTYQVRSMGDQVIEANGGGVDTVFATVSYSLGANEVEMLSTVVQAASDPINLIGNYATQVIIGNYGNNVLNGGSGGVDTLIGLLGDDTYAVGDARVIVIENAGQGNDTLVTSVSYQLRNGASIEAFTAQNRQGSESLVLIGNEFGQTIVGNEGANTLDGRGGSDLLVGGGGPDVFAFTTTPGNGNTDVILAFEAGSDRIGLASDIYSAVTSDGINAGEFVLGTAAQDADDRLIFDRAGGRLFYDADGNGSGAAVLIATFQNPAQLDVNSFVVIPPVSDLIG